MNTPEPHGCGYLPKHDLDARVAELVDALDLGSSGVTRESSSLSFRTIFFHGDQFNQVTFSQLVVS